MHASRHLQRQAQREKKPLLAMRRVCPDVCTCREEASGARTVHFFCPPENLLVSTDRLLNKKERRLAFAQRGKSLTSNRMRMKGTETIWSEVLECNLAF